VAVPKRNDVEQPEAVAPELLSPFERWLTISNNALAPKPQPESAEKILPGNERTLPTVSHWRHEHGGGAPSDWNGSRTARNAYDLVVIVLAAKLVVQIHSVPSTQSERLAIRSIAAEFGFVLWLRGISIRQYLATRDPVAGTAYYSMLVLFALMPLWVGKRALST